MHESRSKRTAPLEADPERQLHRPALIDRPCDLVRVGHAAGVIHRVEVRVIEHVRLLPARLGRPCFSLPQLFYSAFVHVLEPVTLKDTSDTKMCKGLPSAVPRCSVEISRGPAFL